MASAVDDEAAAGGSISGGVRPTLRLERIFDAPRDLVWLAWTNPEMAVRWFGPSEWPAVRVEQDLRVGGEWCALLTSTDGERSLLQSGVYRRIERPSLLEFTFQWDEGHEDGAPVETSVTIMLTELRDGRTHMDFSQSGLKSRTSASGHRHGWTSNFERLATELAAGFHMEGSR